MKISSRHGSEMGVFSKRLWITPKPFAASQCFEFMRNGEWIISIIFVPFVIYVLQKEKQDKVSDAETQLFLRKEFGLSIPQHACGFVLQRLAKRKVLQRRRRVYHIVGELKGHNVDERRVKAEARTSKPW